MIDKVNRPFYLVLRAILRFKSRCILMGFKGFRIIGRENLPGKRTPCILIANHAAFVDSVYLISAVKPRFTICGAKPKYFKHPVRRQVFHIANILKVEDKDQFMKDCGSLLASCEILLIYPEMGRNPEALGEFKTWAAEVAIANKVPAIPCYLYGTTGEQAGPKKLMVGPPILTEGTPEAVTQVYRETILDLKQQTERTLA